MWRFGFLFSVRFWVATWIVILFVGLMPLSPVAELVIVVGCIAHATWFVHRRLHAIAARSPLALVEDRKVGRRPAPRGDSSYALGQAEQAGPKHH